MLQGVDQGRGVEERAATGVDDDRAGLHPLDPSTVQEVVGVRGERDV